MQPPTVQPLRKRGRPRKEGGTSKPPVPHPRDPDISLQQGRRPESPLLWEATFQIGAEPVGPRSLKTTDWGDACYQSGVMKAELAAAARAGVPVKKAQHTFAEAAEEMIAEYEIKMAAAVAKFGWGKGQVWRGHINRLRNPLILAFGHLQVTSITQPVIATFVHNLLVREKPQDPQSPVKAPSQSTVMNLNHTFRRAMKVAARNGWIVEGAIPRMSKADLHAGDNRPAFTLEEVRRLERAMTPEWIAAGLRGESRDKRVILRAYVAMAACTGMRPGVELDRVRWEQIDTDYRTPSNNRVIRIEVEARQGKHTKPRSVIAHQHPRNRVFDLRRELAALREMQGEPAGNTYIFARPGSGEVPELSDLFRELLAELGLRVEKGTQKERVLYSLRHFYGTERAHAGMATFKLSYLMGTSPAMLERYYLHADVDRLADEYSGRPSGEGRRTAFTVRASDLRDE